MADLLEQGAAWLFGVLKQHAAQSLSYHRGVNSVAIQGTFGNPDGSSVNEEGFLISNQLIDILVDAADLILAGNPVEPEAGDQIKRVKGTTTHVYEAVDDGSGTVFTPSDPLVTRYRIHVKYLGTE